MSTSLTNFPARLVVPTTAKINLDKALYVTRNLCKRRRREASPRWWISECSNMMRRLIDTEFRRVCELQRTHKQCAARKVAKRTGEAECERDRGFGVLPR